MGYRNRRLSLAYQMLDVTVILRTNEFEDLFVRQVGDAFLGPRFREDTRVVDGDFDFEMAEIGATVTLNNVQLGRVWMGFHVEPDSIVKSDTIHN